MKVVKVLWLFILMVSWAMITIFPLSWLIVASLKTKRELYASVWRLPEVLTWTNFSRAWLDAKLGIYFVNTLLYSMISVVMVVLVTAMAAYALSKFEFKANHLVFYLFMAGMFIPITLCIVPTFSLLSSLHLIDTRLGLILVYTAWEVPFGTFLLYGYLQTLPREIMDAAALDGCSEFQVFWKIVIPLAKSGLIALSIIHVVWTWNELLFALVIIHTESLRPLSLGVSSLKVAAAWSGDWPLVYAAATASTLPLLGAYILFQKQMVKGITFGALKG